MVAGILEADPLQLAQQISTSRRTGPERIARRPDRPFFGGSRTLEDAHRSRGSPSRVAARKLDLERDQLRRIEGPRKRCLMQFDDVGPRSPDNVTGP